MKKNMGLPDRIVRLVIALLLFAYGVWQGSWIAYFIGLFVVFEYAFSWCIVYQLMGKSTCKYKPKK
ncbi:DUF2892 domain-containing protein [bacterium]|nr:DUF2892 domain-containing protein [bacterium]